MDRAYSLLGAGLLTSSLRWDKRKSRLNNRLYMWLHVQDMHIIYQGNSKETYMDSCLAGNGLFPLLAIYYDLYGITVLS